MIIRVFKSGTSRGEAPVKYLLSMRDHTGAVRSVEPEVLEGHPATTVHVINGIQRKHRYVSGVIAFRNEEEPTKRQMHEVIASFKAAVAPGLDGRHFNSLFVLHREKSNVEIHFIFPMLEFSSGRGKRLNVHPPGARNLALYEAFTQVTNHRMGFGQVVSDPMRAAVSVTDRKLPSSKSKRRSAYILQVEIVQAVQAGHVNTRKELVQWLDDALGVTVTRQGVDYLSVKMPGATKAMRLKGPLFEAGTDYRSLHPLVEARAGTVTLTAPQFQEASARLNLLVGERRVFNLKMYGSRNISTSSQGNGSASVKLKATEIKTTTTKEKTMTMKPSNPIVHEAYTVAKAADAERQSVGKINGKATALNRMTSIRSGAINSKTDSVPSALDEVQNLETAIGALQTSIGAAVTDVANAKTPEERTSAQSRLAKLQQQLARLEAQYAAAKVRQLNQGADKRLKL